MKIKLGDHFYIIPDSCPSDGPKKRTLNRHLKVHGAASLLESKLLRPSATCVVERLVTEGAEVVEQTELDPIPLDTEPTPTD